MCEPQQEQMRITDAEWEYLRGVHRRSGWRDRWRGWLKHLLRIHSPTGHIFGRCWCQRPLAGEVHPPRHEHHPPP